MTPVIVIVIVQELEFEEGEPGEAVASIVGLSSNSGASADTLGSLAAKTTITTRSEAQHRSLSNFFNVPSSHLGQDVSTHKQLPLSLSVAAPLSRVVPNRTPPPPLPLPPSIPYHPYPQYTSTHSTPQLELFSKKILFQKTATSFAIQCDMIEEEGFMIPNRFNCFLLGRYAKLSGN
jgi:hypothetical protein